MLLLDFPNLEFEILDGLILFHNQEVFLFDLFIQQLFNLVFFLIDNLVKSV
jgi:hypothetical protein